MGYAEHSQMVGRHKELTELAEWIDKEVEKEAEKEVNA